MKLPSEVATILGSYVYVYIDPETGQPFYIGKGVGDRMFSHLNDTGETEKVRKIGEIRSKGREPVIDILRYGLSDAEAALVEAAAIDLIGKRNLTNQVSGLHSRSFGRINSREIITMLTAKPTKIQHRAVLITINKLYRSDMTPRELYEVTRGIWKIGERRADAEYALAIYQGVIREVFQINQWFPAGTLDYKTRDANGFKGSGRWEFKGTPAPEAIRNMYIGYSVGPSGQNPIRYANL